MNCLNCDKEISDKAKYCSSKCKMAYRRKTVTNSPKITVTPKTVTGMTKDELYSNIDHYQRDTWKDSPEFKELMRRLKSYSLNRLKEEGYSIPSWKNPVKV